MKCAYHPEVDAVAACVNCGRLICSGCRTVLGEKSYCGPCINKMFTAKAAQSENSWKALAGGILGIIAGACGLLVGAFFLWAGVTGIDTFQNQPFMPVSTHPRSDLFIIVLGAIFLLLGAAAITGSVFALMRKRFWLALTGGICSVFSGWPFGIPALILIVLSRSEFRPSSRLKESK